MQLNLSFPPSFPSNVAWHPPLIRKARTRCDLCRALHDFARLRWHHNAYPPETTAGGSVFREAVSKTLPASAFDQRNAFPEVIKIPESKATAFQTLDSAVYSFNRTVGEIILDAVKNSYHVLLKGGDSCVHVLTRTTVVFQNINEPSLFFSSVHWIHPDTHRRPFQTAGDFWQSGQGHSFASCIHWLSVNKPTWQLQGQRKRRRCWYATVPLWKNTGETDGNKKTPLHFWSEVFEVINTIWQRPDLQLIANFIRFFFVCMEITENLGALIYQLLHLAKEICFRELFLRPFVQPWMFQKLSNEFLSCSFPCTYSRLFQNCG